jgi:hypothetical protein
VENPQTHLCIFEETYGGELQIGNISAPIYLATPEGVLKSEA